MNIGEKGDLSVCATICCHKGFFRTLTVFGVAFFITKYYYLINKLLLKFNSRIFWWMTYTFFNTIAFCTLVEVIVESLRKIALLLMFKWNTIVYIYVSLRLRVQNAVPTQPCVGQLEISLVLLNFLHCNFR